MFEKNKYSFLYTCNNNLQGSDKALYKAQHTGQGLSGSLLCAAHAVALSTARPPRLQHRLQSQGVGQQGAPELRAKEA